MARWSKSFVCADKRGEDAVLLAQKLLRLVKLQDGSSLQDHHEVCTQDRVHAVLRGQEGLVSVVSGTAEDRHLLPSLQESMATVALLLPPSQASLFRVALTDLKLSSQE